MTDYSNYKTQIETTLKEMFPKLEVDSTVFTYEGTIHVFFLKFKNGKELCQSWEKVSNAIAVYYQTKLESQFEVWNLYLFYVNDDTIDRDVKYRIENDTISSRKIVIEGHNGKLNRKLMNTVIAEHITNTDLNSFLKEKKQNMITNFKKDEILWSALSNTSISKKKKNSDEEIRKALLKVENSLR